MNLRNDAFWVSLRIKRKTDFPLRVYIDFHDFKDYFIRRKIVPSDESRIFVFGLRHLQLGHIFDKPIFVLLLSSFKIPIWYDKSNLCSEEKTRKLGLGGYFLKSMKDSILFICVE